MRHQSNSSNFVKIDPNTRNLGIKVRDTSQPKPGSSKTGPYADQKDEVNPFLDGTLANTPSKIKDVDDIISESYAKKRIAKRKLQRHIPWSKVILYSILGAFLSGMIFGIIRIISMLSEFR